MTRRAALLVALALAGCMAPAPSQPTIGPAGPIAVAGPAAGPLAPGLRRVTVTLDRKSVV